MSSAARGSPTIVIARPKTRRWNRCTNAAAASESPVARPASSASSETAHIVFTHRRAARIGPPPALHRTPATVGRPGLRPPEPVTEKAPAGAGVGVEVIRDVPHVVVDVVLDGQLLGGDAAELVEHVLEVGGGRVVPVLAPGHDRDRTDLAFGDPADLVLVVPGRDPRRLAEVTVGIRRVLHVVHLVTAMCVWNQASARFQPSLAAVSSYASRWSQWKPWPASEYRTISVGKGEDFSPSRSCS